MAYTDRTIRLSFDGTQTLEGMPDDETGKLTILHLPNLGENIFVVIRNPMLMPPSMLLPAVDVPLGPDGTPVDRDAAMRAGSEVLARLVVDWHLFDPMDDSDDPQPLPLPATTDHLMIIPSIITRAIGLVLTKARNPH